MTFKEMPVFNSYITFVTFELPAHHICGLERTKIMSLTHWISNNIHAMCVLFHLTDQYHSYFYSKLFILPTLSTFLVNESILELFLPWGYHQSDADSNMFEFEILCINNVTHILCIDCNYVCMYWCIDVSDCLLKFNVILFCNRDCWHFNWNVTYTYMYLCWYILFLTPAELNKSSELWYEGITHQIWYQKHILLGRILMLL